VLADGVAYASKHCRPHVVLDMCTLTGAQGIATGRRHAAVVTNRCAFFFCSPHASTFFAFPAGLCCGPGPFAMRLAPLSCSEEMEDQCVAAGKRSGDLVHPLLYCPEFYTPGT
jgi:probable aminopeptidase NPEPL1